MHQRIDYGSSAALLDHRHPNEVAPVRCSPWSAAGWLAIVAGHPVIGTGVLAVAAAAFPRRLPEIPVNESLRLVAAGHLGAGAQLARAAVRVWWPVLVVAAPVSRRARRILVASAAVVAGSAVRDARGAEPGLGVVPLATVAAMSLLDDVAYGAGVWLGCTVARSARALLPRFAPSTHRFAPI